MNLQQRLFINLVINHKFFTGNHFVANIHPSLTSVNRRDGTSTAFAEYESSPSTGNLKSSPSTSTSLRYSSTSPSTAFRYSSTYSSTRAPVLESSDLTSRNIPVSFFSTFKLGRGRPEAEKENFCYKTRK